MPRGPTARHEGRVCGPAQEQYDLMVIVPGPARPGMVCRAWATSAARRAARHNLIIKVSPLTARILFPFHRLTKHHYHIKSAPQNPSYLAPLIFFSYHHLLRLPFDGSRASVVGAGGGGGLAARCSGLDSGGQHGSRRAASIGEAAGG
jgi:hypothetical protein